VKVVHFTSVHAWNDSRIFWKYCRSLAARAFDVHLVAPQAPDGPRDGVQFHSVTWPAGGRLCRMTLGAWRVYWAARRLDGDIYHFHDPELIPFGLLLKWQGKVVVYDVHEDVPEDILRRHWIPGPLRKTISVVFRIFENWAARRFSVVAAATPFIRDRFRAADAQAVAIRNYPPRDDLSAIDTDAARTERAICYVGGISEDRGIVEAVLASARADARLYLAGRYFTSELRARLECLEEWQNVTDLGFLDREGVAGVLARSAAGLVTLHATPKFIHALPVKMFEYMAAGLPVIASDFPEWRDIIEGNGCGLCVDPTNPDAIAGAIRYVLDNPEEARKMGARGRKAAATKYCWESEFATVLSIYGKLPGSGRAARLSTSDRDSDVISRRR